MDPPSAARQVCPNATRLIFGQVGLADPAKRRVAGLNMPEKKTTSPCNVSDRASGPFEDPDSIKALKNENLTLLKRIAKLQAKLANVDTRLSVLEREQDKYGIKGASYGENQSAEKRLAALLETFDNEKNL